MKKLFGLALIATMAAFTLPAVAQTSGAATYKAKCQMCHAADGSGSTPAGKAMKAPPLSSPAIVKESNSELVAVTLSGKGKMPAYTGKLTDAQVKEVVEYIRTLQAK
jgi:mono/diheme cytochrome c family protein